MTKLTDLSEQDLAALLDVTDYKAFMWLKIAESVSDPRSLGLPAEVKAVFRGVESSTFLQRSSVEELMKLSVEEVERLRRTGELYQRFPYLRRELPRDTETKLRYLRELLHHEREFETRYPVAYETLFDGSDAVNGLSLSSLGALGSSRTLLGPQYPRLGGFRATGGHKTVETRSLQVWSGRSSVKTG